MNRDIQIHGSEKDRTRFVTNRDAGYINGMTDFIQVCVPARALVSLTRACEIFDYFDEVPQLSEFKMVDSDADMVEGLVVKSEKQETWGKVIGRLLESGQVLTYETPVGPRHVRAKHIYNAVAATIAEEADTSASSFYSVQFWSKRAKANFIARIFFGTANSYFAP